MEKKYESLTLFEFQENSLITTVANNTWPN